MQGYRDPVPAAPDTVVPYYPNGRAGGWLLTLVMLSGACWVVWGGLQMLLMVDVQCQRDEGTCAIVTHWPVGETREYIALGTLTGAKTETELSKGRVLYRVVLITTTGDRPVTESYFADGDRVRSAHLLDDFLAGRLPQSSIVEVCKWPSNLGLVFLGLGLLLSWVGWRMAQYARVDVSWRDGVVTVLRFRWPLPAERRTYPLPALFDAIVTERAAGRGRNWGVTLVIEGEGMLPLLSPSSGQAAKEKFVTEIKEIIRIRDAGGPDR